MLQPPCPAAGGCTLAGAWPKPKPAPINCIERIRVTRGQNGACSLSGGPPARRAAGGGHPQLPETPAAAERRRRGSLRHYYCSNLGFVKENLLAIRRRRAGAESGCYFDQFDHQNNNVSTAATTHVWGLPPAAIVWPICTWWLESPARRI